MAKQPEVSITDKKNPSDVTQGAFSPEAWTVHQKALDERAHYAGQCNLLREEIAKLQQRLAQPMPTMQAGVRSEMPRAIILENGVRLILRHVATYRSDGYAIKFFGSDGTEM